MSLKSLWIGPLFGIGCVSLVTIACSGDAFNAESGELSHGGSAPTEPTSGSGQGGNGDTTPEGVTPTTAGTQSDGGAPDQPPPAIGGTSSGGVPQAGGNAGGGGSISGGSGGSLIDPPVQGMGGDPNVPGPPVDLNCTKPIAESWSESLSETGLWHVAWGDPFVDTAQHRLVLSFDDVAERTAPYDGSYYVESDVTIVGHTAFTPYPYTFEVLLPTLRRDAAGAGIELGATQYGPTSWTASGWGDVSGSVIAGTTKVHVGAYMQLTSKKFAVKVSYAGKVYRSTWVTDFHWAKTNLGIMRYIGENNSSVYPGSNDLIYVDQASGCQGLSDAAVADVFKQ